MTWIIVAVFIAAVSSVGFSLLLQYLRFVSAMQRQYGEAVGLFFDAAEPIMEDDEVPSSLRAMVVSLADMIDDRSVPRHLFRSLVHRAPDARRKVPDSYKEAQEFFAIRKELEKPFNEMLAAWLVAVTALRPVYGSLVRVKLFEDEDEIRAVASRSAARRARRAEMNGNGATGGIAQAVC